MNRLKIFAVHVLLPVLAAWLIFEVFGTFMYDKQGEFQLLWAWIIIGLPFGFHKIRTWSIFVGLSEEALFLTLFSIILRLVVGGILGGLALVGMVISGIYKTVRGY